MFQKVSVFLLVLAALWSTGCGRTPGGLQGQYAMYALVPAEDGLREQRVDGLYLTIDGRGNYEMNGNPGHRGRIKLDGAKLTLSPQEATVAGMGEGLPDSIELEVLERGKVLSMEPIFRGSPSVLWKRVEQ